MPLKFVDEKGKEIEPEWRKDESGPITHNAGIFSFTYEESVGKKYKSEKHYNWFLANKNSKEFKDKKKEQNQKYYKKKASILKANRVKRYHKNNPNARFNDPLSRRVREFIHIFC